MRPILVTGAAGFAGSHLVDQLLAEAEPVVAWDRTPASDSQRPAAAGGRAARAMIVDLLDRGVVVSAIADVRPRVIVHCAGAAQVASSWHDTAAVLQANVLGTHHLLDAARQARLDARIVVIGSALVYRPSHEALSESHPLGPSNPYGVSKLAQEMVALEAAREGLDVVVVRPFNHIGPRQQPTFAASSFARQIALAEAGRTPPVITVGNLDARRDVTDVRDTVRGYRLLAARGQPARPYNVCSGHAPTVGELLNRLSAFARIGVGIEVDAARLRPSDNPVVLGDGRRIREEVGWTPEIPLDRTLHDLLEYWRAVVAAG